jgi:general stress protein 26
VALPDRDWAEERLRRSHNYWLATTRPDGRPHLVPIWGIWLDDRFWFASYAGQKVDNIAARPFVVLTTETPREVVILEGTAAGVGKEALADRYAEVFDAKYGAGWSGVDKPALLHFCVTPSTVRAWHEAEAADPPARFRY